ncbi:hypothetical protein PVAND_013391 [Polypedilum vanderplanki]|uniref:Major facilitator superfamily (MFS) profile domain-containing protein n=1 Tax=Polypedilum vanderplanki TaxID=319348 RepID=A0A9J6CR96_POLVA|nr:hypothetical protein PVAND_013391 [Polypedilum vanderplanki]
MRDNNLEIPNEFTALKSSSLDKDKIVEHLEEQKRRSQWIQIACSLMANATVLSSGMGLGFPAITLESLRREDNPLRLDEEQASWFASINTLVCPLGGLLSATILDQLGRRMTLMIINILSITSWSLMYFSSETDFDSMFWQILLSRFLIGVTIGLSSSPAAVYSAEIASPKLRGRMTVLTSMAIAVGILMIYTLGFIFPDDWRIVAGIAAIFCIFTLSLVFFIPESPSWLISRGRIDEGRKALGFIRAIKHNELHTSELLNEEMQRFEDQINSRNNGGNDSLWATLRRPEIYKPLAIINAFFAFQQFSGTFVIVVYAAKFAEEAGTGIDKFLCTVLIGVARVVATIILAYFILDRYGRKPPSIFSGIGMTISMLILAVYSSSSFSEYLPFHSWVSTFYLLAYIVTSTFGFLTIPFTMLPELFPQRVRGITAGLTVCVAYFMSFLAIKSYPSLLQLIGNDMIFLLYGIVSLLGTLFVHFILPETKGKSLQEIENLFKRQTSTSAVKA